MTNLQNLVSAAAGQTTRELTLEAQRQADENAAAQAAGKRRRADERRVESAADRLAESGRLSPEAFMRRINAATAVVAAWSARKGAALTDPEFEDLMQTLAVYGLSAGLNAPGQMPKADAVGHEGLVKRGKGILTEWARQAAPTESIDADAAIGDSLTETARGWIPSADADELADAMGAPTRVRIAIHALLGQNENGAKGGGSKATRGIDSAAIGRQFGMTAMAARQNAKRGRADLEARWDDPTVLSADLSAAGLADLSDEERAVIEEDSMRQAAKNAETSRAATSKGIIAPRVLNAAPGSTPLVSDAARAILSAADKAADENGTDPRTELRAAGYMVLSGIESAGSSNGGQVIEREHVDALDPYQRAGLIPAALAHTARQARAARNEHRNALRATTGRITVDADSVDAQAAALRNARRKAAAPHRKAAAVWAARADQTADAFDQSQADRYAHNAERIMSAARVIPSYATPFLPKG